jgi:hypothetical protein
MAAVTQRLFVAGGDRRNCGSSGTIGSFRGKGFDTYSRREGRNLSLAFAISGTIQFLIDKFPLLWYTFLEYLNNPSLATIPSMFEGPCQRRPSLLTPYSTVYRPSPAACPEPVEGSIVLTEMECLFPRKKSRSNKHCFT